MSPVNLTRVLLIEDSPAEARLIRELLKDAHFQEFSLVYAKRLSEALKYLENTIFDVVLLDLTLPDSHGLASLQPLILKAPDLAIVVLTNTNDDQLAIEAVRQGAQDYLFKRQVTLEVLTRSLRYAIERKQLVAGLRAINENLESRVQERTAELLQAREINRSKSEFVSMISHDFRNPLTTILLSTGLLQESEERLTKEQKSIYFNRIQSAIKDMAQLLDEVSFIGKSDSGRLQSQLLPLNIELFCYQFIDELQGSLGNKCQFTFLSQGEFHGGLWDVVLLRHIFRNLLTNAVKYSAPGGCVKVELIRKESTVICRIQDWGMGIPESDRKRLFQPFHRGSNVDTIPGTGLGLAIVKRCIEACGGDIDFESYEGVGTIFTCKLPFITNPKAF